MLVAREKLAEYLKNLDNVVDVDVYYDDAKVIVKVIFQGSVSLDEIKEVVKMMSRVFRGCRVLGVSLFSTNFIDVFVEFSREG
jgi:hypothetical protein